MVLAAAANPVATPRPADAPAALLGAEAEAVVVAAVLLGADAVALAAAGADAVALLAVGAAGAATAAGATEADVLAWAGATETAGAVAGAVLTTLAILPWTAGCETCVVTLVPGEVPVAVPDVVPVEAG